MSQVLHSTTDFGLNLIRQHNLNESLVFSPLSIALALSLVHLAARGETRTEIREVIANGSTDEQYEKHFSNISKYLSASNEKIEIKLANHIFPRLGFSIKQQYLGDVKNLYNAGTTQLNFSNKVNSAGIINKYVGENTKGKIKSIIEPQQISEGLVAVLINAVYFNAKWADRFYPQSTSKRNFFSSADSKQEIEFLHARKVFRQYSQNDQFEVLTLPYQDETFALSIFLPKSRFDLTNFIKRLDSAAFQNLLFNSESAYVNVAIPKFKIETESKLNEALMSIGIKKAFSSSADLGNMANGIYVNEVFHKAFIEVEESGTTAAAATNVNMLVSGLRMSDRTKKPKDFIADHPFLFILSKDNNPVFLGIHK